MIANETFTAYDNLSLPYCLATFLTILPSLTICKIMQEKDVKNTGNVQDTANSNEELLDMNADSEVAGSNHLSNPADEISEMEKLQEEAAEWKDKYMRLVAEFDNFRKRNARERIELTQTAGKDIIVSLLDVLDDSERAQKQVETSNDAAAIKEGVLLVFNKLRNTLQAKGLKQMTSVGKEFNPDLHEAITEIPAPSKDAVGKVIDEVQKGYYLNDKIIRFAKVVVGK
jgi:molecular chaperone GrpE